MLLRAFTPPPTPLRAVVLLSDSELAFCRWRSCITRKLNLVFNLPRADWRYAAEEDTPKGNGARNEMTLRRLES